MVQTYSHHQNCTEVPSKSSVSVVVTFLLSLPCSFTLPFSCWSSVVQRLFVFIVFVTKPGYKVHVKSTFLPFWLFRAVVRGEYSAVFSKPRPISFGNAKIRNVEWRFWSLVSLCVCVCVCVWVGRAVPTCACLSVMWVLACQYCTAFELTFEDKLTGHLLRMPLCWKNPMKRCKYLHPLIFEGDMLRWVLHVRVYGVKAGKQYMCAHKGTRETRQRDKRVCMCACVMDN